MELYCTVLLCRSMEEYGTLLFYTVYTVLEYLKSMELYCTVLLCRSMEEYGTLLFCTVYTVLEYVKIWNCNILYLLCRSMQRVWNFTVLNCVLLLLLLTINLQTTYYDL